jgi:hypothetical protein
MAGSPIYRIGHERWLRNLAIALGNAPSAEDVLAALEKRREDASLMVREHVAWALDNTMARTFKALYSIDQCSVKIPNLPKKCVRRKPWRKSLPWSHGASIPLHRRGRPEGRCASQRQDKFRIKMLMRDGERRRETDLLIQKRYAWRGYGRSATSPIS